MKKRNLWDQPSKTALEFFNKYADKHLYQQGDELILLTDEDMLIIQTLRIIFDAAPRNLFKVHTIKNKNSSFSESVVNGQLCILSVDEKYALDTDVHSRMYAEVITPMFLRYHQFRKRIPQTESYKTCRGEKIKYMAWRIHVPTIKIYTTSGKLEKEDSIDTQRFQLIIELPKYVKTKNNLYGKPSYRSTIVNVGLVEKFIYSWNYKNKIIEPPFEMPAKEIPFKILVKDLLWFANAYGLEENKRPIKTTNPWRYNKRNPFKIKTYLREVHKKHKYWHIC